MSVGLVFAIVIPGILFFSFVGIILWLYLEGRKGISQSKEDEQSIIFRNLIKEMFRSSDVGVTCAEFELLAIAGPTHLSAAIHKRMDEHLEDCEYHRSKQWHQSAVNSFSTPELEKAALEVIEKYCDA